MYLTWLSLDTSWLTPLLEARSDRTHLSLQPIITLFLRPLSHLLFCSSFVQRLPSVLFFGPKIDVALPVLAPVIPSRTRQTVQPGGAIHQLPSAVTLHLTAANVDVWLSWKPERQVPVWPPLAAVAGPCAPCACDGQEPVVCYGVSPPSANHTASCLFEQGPWCPAVRLLWRRKMKCKKLSKLSCHWERVVKKKKREYKEKVRRERQKRELDEREREEEGHKNRIKE